MAADGHGSTGIALRLLRERARRIPDLPKKKNMKQTGSKMHVKFGRNSQRRRQKHREARQGSGGLTSSGTP